LHILIKAYLINTVSTIFSYYTSFILHVTFICKSKEYKSTAG